jgi:hypothetical protein
MLMKHEQGSIEHNFVTQSPVMLQFGPYSAHETGTKVCRSKFHSLVTCYLMIWVIFCSQNMNKGL